MTHRSPLACAILCSVATVLVTTQVLAQSVPFRRGDADASGVLEITDGIRILEFLFLGELGLPCQDAGDTDDNSTVELADAVSLFGYLFLGGARPRPPGPVSCGGDPTPDDLTCLQYSPTDVTLRCPPPAPHGTLFDGPVLLQDPIFGFAPEDLDHDGAAELLIGDIRRLTILGAREDERLEVRGTESTGRALKIATGDFNGDGDPDVVVSAPMRLFFGDGEGGFVRGEEFPFWDHPRSTALATTDLDLDGALDVAALEGFAILPDATFDLGGEVGVRLGNGAGGLEAFATYLESNALNRLSISAGDINGDGFPDLVTAGAGVSIFINAGDGTFADAVDANIAVEFPLAQLDLGDLDGDGLADIVGRLDGGATGVLVFLAAGGGAFLPAGEYPVGPEGLEGVDIVDLDGDGTLDILGTGEIFTSLIGFGDGTFSVLPPSTGPAWGSATEPIVADFTGDGVPDVAVVRRSTTLAALFVGHGDGTLGAGADSIVLPMPGATLRLAVGDLTLDGRPDLVVSMSTGELSVVVAEGAGVFKPPQAYADGSGHLALADLDSDGDVDVASASGATMRILCNRGDGTLMAPRVVDLPGAHPLDVQAGDVDGDGGVDLAVYSRQGSDWSVEVLFNQGGASFAPPASASGGSERGSVNTVMADVDNDGDLDLVIAGRGIWISENQGGSPFVDPRRVDTGVRAWIAAADVSGDGNIDLAAPSSGNGTMATGIALLLGAGDGDFTFHDSYGVGAGPNFATFADLDGDGHLDLLTSNGESKTYTIHRGKGDGDFVRAGEHHGLLVQPKEMAVGDMDDDGDLDLVYGRLGTGVEILLNQTVTHRED